MARFSFEKNLTRIVKQKQLALQNQNPVLFYQACETGGFSGEEDIILYETGQKFILSNNEEAKLKAPLSRRKTNRKIKFNYEFFGQEVRAGNYDPNNIFSHIEAKKQLLKKYGIRKLITGTKEKALIEDAKPARVGRVFQERFSRYLTNQKNY